MSDEREAAIRADIGTVLRMRETNGGHLHHRNCIHNLTPKQQIEMRGKSVEWWQTYIGPLPEQITSDDWQIEPPQWAALSLPDPKETTNTPTIATWPGRDVEAQRDDSERSS